jgi:NAD(P)H-flavin reductase
MLVPKCYKIQSISQDAHDVFTIVLEKPQSEWGQTFLPGQFNMLYQFGFGEVAITISGKSSDSKTLVHTIRAVGSVTHSLQKMKPGDEIGLRGPFGTHWPLSEKGRDVLVIAGGVGMATLRPAMFALAENSSEYRKITLLYGSKTADDILYRKDMEEWKPMGIDVQVTLDHADDSWKGHVGVVTSLIKANLPNPENTLVLLCGPEIMMQVALQELTDAHVDEKNVYVSLERNMQCAVGFCGHCLYGPYFICKDGPVFAYPQVKKYLAIKEV